MHAVEVLEAHDEYRRALFITESQMRASLARWRGVLAYFRLMRGCLTPPKGTGIPPL